ncbi:MAG: hypothetical protein AAGG01_05360 [Planctomycetota bacterium]
MGSKTLFALLLGIGAWSEAAGSQARADRSADSPARLTVCVDGEGGPLDEDDTFVVVATPMDGTRRRLGGGAGVSRLGSGPIGGSLEVEIPFQGIVGILVLTRVRGLARRSRGFVERIVTVPDHASEDELAPIHVELPAPAPMGSVRFISAPLAEGAKPAQAAVSVLFPVTGLGFLARDALPFRDEESGALFELFPGAYLLEAVPTTPGRDVELVMPRPAPIFRRIFRCAPGAEVRLEHTFREGAVVRAKWTVGALLSKELRQEPHISATIERLDSPHADDVAKSKMRWIVRRRRDAGGGSSARRTITERMAIGEQATSFDVYGPGQYGVELRIDGRMIERFSLTIAPGQKSIELQASLISKRR